MSGGGRPELDPFASVPFARGNGRQAADTLPAHGAGADPFADVPLLPGPPPPAPDTLGIQLPTFAAPPDTSAPPGMPYPSPVAPDRLELPPVRSPNVGEPGQAADFAQGIASSFLTAPFAMARGAIGTVFGNPTAEELANPLLRAAIVARMGRMPDIQPSTTGPAEEAAQQLKGFVTLPYDAGKELVDNPEATMRERGEATGGLIMGAEGILHGAKAARGALERRAEGGRAQASAPEPPPRPEPTPPIGITAGVTPKAEPLGIFDDVPFEPSEGAASEPGGPQEPDRAPPVTPPAPRETGVSEGASKIVPNKGPERTPYEQAQLDLAEIQAGRQVPPPPGSATQVPYESTHVPGDNYWDTGRQPGPERIRAAAVEVDGRRFEGRDHFDAIQKAQAAGVDVGAAEARSGYVTESGRFVDDQEGLAIAKAAGQYRGDVPPSSDERGPYLDSADLEQNAGGEKFPPGPRDVRDLPETEPGPTSENEPPAGAIPPDLTIEPGSRYADETDPAGLYAGARDQARSHAGRAGSLELLLERGRKDNGRPLTEKEIQSVRSELAGSVHLYRSTLDEIGMAFGEKVRDQVDREILAELAARKEEVRGQVKAADEAKAAPKAKKLSKREQQRLDHQLPQLQKNLEGQRRQRAAAIARGEDPNTYGHDAAIAALEAMIAKAKGKARAPAEQPPEQTGGISDEPPWMRPPAPKPDTRAELGLKAGDFIKTSYGTGPYRIRAINHHPESGNWLDLEEAFLRRSGADRFAKKPMTGFTVGDVERHGDRITSLGGRDEIIPIKPEDLDAEVAAVNSNAQPYRYVGPPEPKGKRGKAAAPPPIEQPPEQTGEIADEPPIDIPPERKRALRGQARRDQLEQGRTARASKATDEQLFAQLHPLIVRIQESPGPTQWTRYDDDIAETRSGVSGGSRLRDDQAAADVLDRELKRRGYTDDQLATHYYDWLDATREREGIAREDVGGRGADRVSEDFNPDALGHPRPRDLFGAEEADRAPAQGSMFDERAGTEATRSTPEHLRALAAERDKLAQLIKGKLRESPSANARLAELDRVLNREQKIGGAEMSTRARAEATPAADPAEWVFQKVDERQGRLDRAHKTVPGDVVTWRGRWRGKDLELRSTMRRVGGNMEHFTTHSAERIRGEAAGKTAEVVDLQVVKGELTERDLQDLAAYAQRFDERPVRIRMRGETLGEARNAGDRPLTDRELDEPGPDQGSLLHPRDRPWSGFVDLRDGHVERTWTHAEAAREDFHHQRLLSRDQLDRIDNQEGEYFWLDRNGRPHTHEGPLPRDLADQVLEQLRGDELTSPAPRGRPYRNDELGPDQGSLLTPEPPPGHPWAMKGAPDHINTVDAVRFAREHLGEEEFRRRVAERVNLGRGALHDPRDAHAFEVESVARDVVAEAQRAGELEAPAPRGRPYRNDELDTMGLAERERALRYEEQLAMRELGERERGGDTVHPKPGEPSKSPEELVGLEHELAAAERKLAETQSEKLKQILTAQVFNRLRQQETYVREYVNAGRAAELAPEVRARFPDMQPGQAEPEGQGPDRGRYDRQRQAREEWERRMRERARAQQEERDRERQQRQEREREGRGRGDRQRGGEAEPPPPPPRERYRRPPAGPSMSDRTVPGPLNPRGQVKSLMQIGRDFSDALGVTVRQGRFNAALRKALGIFKVRAETVRVLRADMLDVVSHEVGHFISKEYLHHPTTRGAKGRGAVPLTRAMLEELRGMGRRLYGDRKPAMGYGEEGIAEWSNFYVTDPTRAATEAPRFTEFMEQQAFRDTPKLGAALRAAREDFARHAGATPRERLDAMKAPKARPLTLPNLLNVVRLWLDDLDPFRRLDQQIERGGGRGIIYELARNTRGSAGMAERWLEHGMVDLRDGRRVAGSVHQALQDVGERALPDFESYLMAESALERWEAGINPGIAKTDAEAVAAELGPRFKQPAAVVWQHYNALLEAYHASGQLTDRGYRAILERNRRHVGFYRQFEDFERPAGGGAGKGGRMGGGAGLKRQTGSARPIISPLESLITDTYRTADKISRYGVIGELIKATRDEKVSGLGRILDEVPAPKDAVEIYAPHVLDQLRDLGLVKIGADGQVRPLVAEDVMGEVLTAFRDREIPGAAERKDLVIPFRKGDVTRWYQVMDRPLYDALEGLGPPGLQQWLRWGGKSVRAFRAGVTLTGRFIMKNIVRDATTAFIRTRAGHRLIPGTDALSFAVPFEHFITGLGTLAKRPDIVERWRLGGGDTATQLGLDRAANDQHVRRLARRGTFGGQLVDIVRHPVDTVRLMSQYGENLTRLGEYRMVERRAMREGAGPAEVGRRAAYASRDVTQDFAMAGSAGRQVNQLIAFFNAAVNSVGNLGRDLARRPEVVVPRIIAGVSLPSLALYWSQRKDPEYQRTPRWVRDVAWVYIQRGTDRGAGWDGYGSGKLTHRWYIPKPFEVGVLFGTTVERFAEWAESHDPEAFAELGKSIWQAMTPDYLPPSVASAVEVATNYDRFRDRPIVPRSLEGLDPREQASPRVGETARLLGRAAPGRGVSPNKIEHLVSGNLGGLGMAALGVSDAGIRAFRQAAGLTPLRPNATALVPDPEEDPLANTPLINAFAGRDPMESAQDIERVYTRFEGAERSRQTWMYLLKNGRPAEAAAYLKSHLAEIRSVATSQMTGGTPGTLRAEHDAIEKMGGVGRIRPDRRRELLGRMHELTGRLKGRD